MRKMNKWKEKLEKILMQISYQERRKKAVAGFKVEINYLKQMDNYEIEFEYIKLKTSYEHKKRTLSVLLVSILLSFLMGVWRHSYNLIEQAIRFWASFQSDETLIVKMTIVLFGIIVALITLLVIWLLLNQMKSLDLTYQKLLIMEEYRNGKIGEKCE